MNIINPYRFAGATGGLLDQYTGASAAFSLRELSDAWAGQNVVRVSRTSDNAFSDFTSSEVADGTMTTWVNGAGTAGGKVITWYDQSGNGNDVTQTQSAAPRIVASGTAVTLGGAPSMDWDATSNWYLQNTSFSGDFSDQSVFCVAQAGTGGSYRALVGHVNDATTTGREIWVGQDNSATPQFGQAAYSGGGSLTFGGNASSQFLGSLTAADGGNITSYVDGTQVAQNTAGTFQSTTSNTLYIGFGGGSFYWNGGFAQEVVLYPSDQSANRTGIETNINAHYSIYV